MQPGTKLTNGLQEVQIITTHKILSQIDNGHHQWHLWREKKNHQSDPKMKINVGCVCVFIITTKSYNSFVKFWGLDVYTDVFKTNIW